MKNDFTKPMLFTGETQQRKFVAYIDPENKFCIEDKLSQVCHDNNTEGTVRGIGILS